MDQVLDLARREPDTHGKAASSRIITLSEGGPQDYLPASSSVGRCCCHLGAALRCFLGDSRMLPSTWRHSCSMGVEHCVSTQELSDCSLSAAELTRSPAEQPNPFDEYQICACQLKQASVLDMLTLRCHPLCNPCARCCSNLPQSSAAKLEPLAHLAQGCMSGRPQSPGHPSRWSSSSCLPAWLLHMLALHHQWCKERWHALPT